jgi:hypothetical protein
MVVRLAFSVFILSCLLISTATSQEACINKVTGEVVCAQPGGVCDREVTGKVACSKPGGSVIKTNMGKLVCGPGQCVKDGLGQVFCSSQPYGGAALDGLGKAVCAGGCVEGSVSYCASTN